MRLLADFQHGRYRRRHVGQLTALTHAGEEVEIEEVHESQHQQHDAHLSTEDLKHTLGSSYRFPCFQVQRDKADVHQIKTHHEQVVDTICQFMISMETLHEKDTP